MDLTPGERAILSQLRELYAKTAKRDQPLTTITAQWPPIHYEAYRSTLAALCSKNLLKGAGTQTVTITDAGLKAMGVTTPIAASSTQTIDLRVHALKNQPRKRSPGGPTSGSMAQVKRSKGNSGLNVVGGLGALAILVSAGWLIWRFL